MPSTQGQLPAPEELFPAVVARRAADTPDRPFLEEVTGRTASYAEFEELTGKWAGALASIGVGPGDLVVTLLGQCIEFHGAWLGAVGVGAVFSPLNTEYRGTILVHALKTTGARVVLAAPDLIERLAEIATDVPGLETVVAVGGDCPPETVAPFRVVSAASLLDAAPPLSVLARPEPWDTALALFTSGTTGPSKAVLLPWARVHLFTSLFFPLTELGPDDVYYCPWPVFHLSGTFPPFLMARIGGKVVLRERMSIIDLLSDLNAFGCTMAVATAGVLNFLAHREPKPEDRELPLRHLFLAPPVIPDFAEFSLRFEVRLSVGYAMTEVGPVFISHHDDITSQNWTSVGRLVDGYPGYEAAVVDEHDRPVEAGMVGELIVRAAAPWTLNAGYLGMPEQTANAWQNGWFHTGDAFRRGDDGNFYFVDRIKDTIRRRNENISSFEVEALVAEHPEVTECAAVPVPGDDGDDVKVVVVRTAGSTLDGRDLVEWLIPRMPRFMVPRYVEFLERLPKTETQKIRKFELRSAGVTDGTWDRVAAGVEIPR